MASRRSFIWVSVLLLITWFFYCTYIYRTYEPVNLSATASQSSESTSLQRDSSGEAELPFHNNINKFRRPYIAWVHDAPIIDAATYVRVGLGFATRHGMRFSYCVESNSCTPKQEYAPYMFQGPGTSFVIGGIAALFGAKSALPYFICVCLIHYLSVLAILLIAVHYISRPLILFIVGLTSLLYRGPFNFPDIYPEHVGLDVYHLFYSEHIAILPLSIGLAILCFFWFRLKNSKIDLSLSKVALYGFFFGLLLAGTSYVREIYATFFLFCTIALIGYALIKNYEQKRIILFSLVGILTLTAIQLPWRLRNLAIVHYPAFSTSAHYGQAMWVSQWEDWQDNATWCSRCAMGLGDYLAPEQSPKILSYLSRHPDSHGAWQAIQKLLKVCAQHPIKAATFRLRTYDNLWLGDPIYPRLYIWSIAAVIMYFLFCWKTRFSFNPALHLFPLFLLTISLLIHYEYRYSQPFHIITAPIAFGYLLQSMLLRTDRRPKFKAS